MAVVYFAKVNINSNIYDVYKNPDLVNKILDELLEHIDSEHLPIKINKEESIAFFDVEKNMDKHYVAGRLSKIFRDNIEIYNSKKNSVEPFSTEDVVKSTLFFFDLRSEIVAFMTAQSISRKNFVSYFKILLNSYTEDVKFEVFLKTNSRALDEQIGRIGKVSKVDFTVVPPNSNEDEFNDLFPRNGEEIKETRATKLQQTLSSSKKDDGINMGASFLRRIIEAVSKGFGAIKVIGETDDNHTLSASNYSTPQKVIMPDKFKNDIAEFSNYAHSEIKSLISSEKAYSMKE